MSCPLTLISSSCWSGAFLVLLSVGCAAGSCFLCLACYLLPSLPLFSPLWLLFHCCHSLSYVSEDEHLDVAIIGKFFVHSSASVCTVPLKQHAIQGRQHAWQVGFAHKTLLTNAMWNGSRDFYFVSLLLFYVITQISLEGDLRKLSERSLRSGQDQIHPCPFSLVFA